MTHRDVRKACEAPIIDGDAEGRYYLTDMTTDGSEAYLYDEGFSLDFVATIDEAAGTYNGPCGTTFTISDDGADWYDVVRTA